MYKSHSLQACEEIIYFDSCYHECKAMEKLDIELEAPRGWNEKQTLFARSKNVVGTGSNHFSLIMWQNMVFLPVRRFYLEILALCILFMLLSQERALELK